MLPQPPPSLAIGISLVSQTRSMRDVLEFCESASVLGKTHLPLDTKLELQSIYIYQKYVRFVSLLISFAYQMLAICVLEFESCAARPPLTDNTARALSSNLNLHANVHTIFATAKRNTQTHTHGSQFGCASAEELYYTKGTHRLLFCSTPAHYSIVSCTKGFEIISRFNH